jgi:hypothetical protein
MTAAIRERRIRPLAAVLPNAMLAAIALLPTVILVIIEIGVLRRHDFARLGDSFALWTYPVIARSHGASVLYNAQGLHAAQVGLGMPRHARNPFPFPPTFLLVLWPLGALPYLWASAMWMLTTLGLYLAAVSWRTPSWRLTALLAAVVPTSLITLSWGQSGFLSAALMIGGMRLAWSRPLLGGILLGVLTCKPQLGLLVPVALAAAGLWSCMLAAALTTMALILVTSAAFGWTIWLIWLKSVPGYAQLYLNAIGYDRISPTVTANLQKLGAPAWLTADGQIVAGIAAAAVVWWSFRHRSREAALLTLCAATFLATPHALLYDLTMLGGAILLYRAWHGATVDALSIGKKTALLAALWLPFVVGCDLRVPLSTIILLGVIWAAVDEPGGRLGRVRVSGQVVES